MILEKMIVFPVLVCILEKCSRKYFTLCVWSNVKQNNKKKPHPKPPKSTKNGNHHCQPPKPTLKPTTSHPHRNQPKTHLATHTKTIASHPNPPCQPSQPTPKPTTRHHKSTKRERAEKEEADRCQDILASLVGSGSGAASVCACRSDVDLEALGVSAALGFHEAGRTERVEKDEADRTCREREQRE